MQQESHSIITVIVLGTVILLSFVVFVVSFLLFFTRRQIQHRLEKAAMTSQYEQEILKSQIETQNLTMRIIGEELHDNIGQLLTVVKINLCSLEETQASTADTELINQTVEIVSMALNDLRALTKSLDHEYIRNLGLAESIESELKRLPPNKRLQTKLLVTGSRYSLKSDQEIVIFRIFQELLTNSLKHSAAGSINIYIIYGTPCFILKFEDNGKGFDTSSISEGGFTSTGIGLRNIFRRAEVIGAKCLIESKPGQGTKVSIELSNIQ
jgi:two-component system NarL family sensor kinase